jgi:hypothetical protein
VAEESLLIGDHAWFYDVRTPIRRMAVSTHAEHGVVILSTWLGDTCTGTFRLPLSQSASLISVLAAGMAQGLPPRPADGPSGPLRRVK